MALAMLSSCEDKAAPNEGPEIDQGFELTTKVLEFEAYDKNQLTKQITITTSNNWKVMTSEDGEQYSHESWIAVSPTSGTGNGVIKFTALANTTDANRVAYIYISNTDIENPSPTKIEVNQKALTGSNITVSNAELNFMAVSSSSLTQNLTLTVDGNWRVMTSEDGDAYQHQSWLRVSPSSGKGSSEIQFKVSNNQINSQRSTSVYFICTDIENSKPVKVVVNQDPSGSGISTYKNLGCGYDASGLYADQFNVKAQVLDWDKLNHKKLIAPLNPVNDTEIRTVSGNNSTEYQTNLSVNAGISGGYLAFSASVQSSFSTTKTDYVQSKYSTVRSVVRNEIVKLVDGTKVDQLKDCLTDEAISDIVDGNISAQAVIHKYGTHIIAGYANGGVYEFDVFAVTKAEITTNSFGTAVTAGFKGMVDVNTDVSTYNALKAGSHEFTEKSRTRGGVYDGNYNVWAKSLTPHNSVMADFVGTERLYPIWEFAEGARRTELEEAVKATLGAAFPDPTKSVFASLQVKLYKFGFDATDVGGTAGECWVHAEVDWLNNTGLHTFFYIENMTVNNYSTVDINHKTLIKPQGGLNIFQDYSFVLKFTGSEKDGSFHQSFGHRDLNVKYYAKKNQIRINGDKSVFNNVQPELNKTKEFFSYILHGDHGARYYVKFILKGKKTADE